MNLPVKLKPGLTAVATLFFATWIAGASQASLLDLPDGGRPVEVQAAFHLLNINKIDDETETFEFSGVLTLIWRDTRQAFDPVKEGIDEKVYQGSYQFNELSPAWYPQVVLANASGVPEIQGVLLRVKPDGTNTLIQSVNAVARSGLALRRYPFDHQRLEAVFEILGFDTSEVTLTLQEMSASVDHTKIRVPEWKLTDIDASPRTMVAPYVGTKARASAFVLTLDVQRQSSFMMRLVLLPNLLIVVLSWSVFWMDRSSLGDRMSVSFVGILTVVAYQSLLSDIMPQISYVTLLNAFLNFSFMLMCATVVVNLVVGECDKQGDLSRGDRIDRRCRWIFPLVYAGLMLATVTVVFLFF
jgi:hypothetical protein